MSFTVLSWCDGCLCDLCEECLWAAGVGTYDPHFFCGDPIWGLELLGASGNKPCEPTSGNVVIPISGIWFSFSSTTLTSVPMAVAGPIKFQWNQFSGLVDIYTFDPSMGGIITDFVATTPAFAGDHGAGGALIYGSSWSANVQLPQSGIELGTLGNPYHTNSDPSKWTQTDFLGSGTFDFLGVFPYTGPDPDVGERFSFGWDLSAYSQLPYPFLTNNILFSFSYVEIPLGSGMWFPDPGRPANNSDIYQLATVGTPPNAACFRVNTLVE